MSDMSKFSDEMPSVRPTVGYRSAGGGARSLGSRVTSKKGARLVAKDYALSPRSGMGATPTIDARAEMAIMDRKIKSTKSAVRDMESQYQRMLEKEVEREMIKRQLEQQRREREQREREARIAAEIVRQREERERQRRIAAELERRRMEREREERIQREIERQRIRRQLEKEERERARREREARIAEELERARIAARIAREEEEREREARAARHNVDLLKETMLRDINSRLALGEKTWTIPLQFSTPSEHELYIDLLQGKVENREAAPYKVTVTEKYERL